jgi:hypothetical protein
MPPLPTNLGTRSWRQGLHLTASLIAVVLLVVGVVVAWTGWRNSTAAEGAIKSYFAALQDGDAARALALGDLPDGPRTLLTDEVLAAQRHAAPIQAVSILSIAEQGGTATASVRYTLAYPGAPQVNVDTVRLRRSGSDWRLAQAAVLTTLNLRQATGRATLAGHALPKGRTLLFPGAVPITFDTPYLALDPQASKVGLSTRGGVDVGVTVSAKGRTALASLLTKDIKTCLATPTAASACPLPTGVTVPGSVHGTLTGQVADALRLSVGTDPAGLIQIGGEVAFSGSYQVLDFDNLPVAKKTPATIPLAASAYAVEPLVVQWSVQS